MLEKMRVDVIEGGFPIASPGDFESVKAIAQLVKDSTICGLARALEKDIDRAQKRLSPLTLGVSTLSSRPRRFTCKTNCAWPQTRCWSKPYSPWNAPGIIPMTWNFRANAGRSEFDFLCRVIEAAIAAGARTINIPDTVGYDSGNHGVHFPAVLFFLFCRRVEDNTDGKEIVHFLKGNRFLLILFQMECQ